LLDTRRIIILYLSARYGLAVFCGAAATLLTPTLAGAQALSGEAKVIDGDSLEIAGRLVRLFGIDAPEFDQTCHKDSENWSCGRSAKDKLAALVAGQRVECTGQDVDTHGRLVAICAIGGDQLNQAMVEQGWALAYRQFSDAYVPAELHAKAEGLGIWSSTFMAPSDYRMAKAPPEARSVPRPARASNQQSSAWSGGCTIKGNRNRRGEWIYHLPGMPYYEQTRAEDIFCSEAQAMAAGYRRARVRQ
jgi:endonuclease YncB( thermonuclease family)